jgi:DNA-binding response OmpR family regulator
VNHPGKAFSFEQIRGLGWQDAVRLPIDIYAIRSLIQRLRAKLRAVNAPVTIHAVRSFGFRLEPAAEHGSREDRSSRLAT